MVKNGAETDEPDAVFMVSVARREETTRLAGAPTGGVGGHWWYQFIAADYNAAQLPARVGHLHKPPPW